MASGIFKSDIRDYFSIFCCIKTTLSANSNKAIIYKRIFSDKVTNFKYLMLHVNWNDILNDDINKSY